MYRMALGVALRYSRENGGHSSTAHRRLSLRTSQQVEESRPEK